MRKNTLVWLGLLLLILIIFFLIMHKTDLRVDEYHHYQQIKDFLDGKFQIISSIATIPGYHVIIAGLAYLSQFTSVSGLRLITFIFSLVSVVIFNYIVSTNNNYRDSIIQTFQYAFFPLIFPFFFLIYTDILSLLCILLAFFLAMRRQPRLAGLLATLSMLIRQNNIIWALVIMMLVFIDEFQISKKDLARLDLSAITPSSLLTFVKKTWTFLLGIIAFIVFVIINKGVSLGDTAMHPAFTWHTGNVFFFLFLSFLLLMPLHISNMKRVLNSLRSSRGIILLILLAAVYFTTFKSNHPYNAPWADAFLRNKILIYFTSSSYLWVLFFVPIAIAAMSFAVTPLRDPAYYLLYPATFLFLIPSWLIEQRYYIIPFTLFFIMKKEDSPCVSWTTLAIFIGISLWLFWGITTGRFFL